MKKISGQDLELIQILTIMNDSKLNLKMNTEAMGQIERIGLVEGYIQTELSTPFARASLTAL